MEKWKIIHIYKNETKGHPTPRPTQPHKRSYNHQGIKLIPR